MQKEVAAAKYAKSILFLSFFFFGEEADEKKYSY